MDKTDRKNIVKLLQLSKTYLWNGVDRRRDCENRYICMAIYEAGEATPEYKKLVWVARDIINFRLCGTFSLEKWLKSYMGIPKSQLTNEKMQAH